MADGILSERLLYRIVFLNSGSGVHLCCLRLREWIAQLLRLRIQATEILDQRPIDLGLQFMLLTVCTHTFVRVMIIIALCFRLPSANILSNNVKCSNVSLMMFYAVLSQLLGAVHMSFLPCPQRHSQIKRVWPSR